MIRLSIDENTNNINSYFVDISDIPNNINSFINDVCNYVESNKHLKIYIYDAYCDDNTNEVVFNFANVNNESITNLEDVYDVFDTAVEYAIKDNNF
jgi:predicted ATP-grasp superfamily ATP-dependent carboligase